MGAPFVGLFVCLGEGIRYRFRVCSSGGLARFRARFVDASGGRPTRGRAPLRRRRLARLGTCPASVAPDSIQSLSARVGDAGREFRPSRDMPEARHAVYSVLAKRRCHVAIGRHALHLPSLFGASTRVGARCLSHAPAQVAAACWGRLRHPNGSLSLTAFCDRTAASPAQGYIGFPVANAFPSGGRPPFAPAGMGGGGGVVDVPRRRWMSMWGTVGHVFCMRQGEGVTWGGPRRSGATVGYSWAWATNVVRAWCRVCLRSATLDLARRDGAGH